MRILFVIGASEYDSTRIFIKEMAEAMGESGWTVELLDGTDTQSYAAKREQVTRSSYDVVFTVNGMLLEDDSMLGQALLADEKVLYCTYLMDHPMIHWERLKKQYPYMLVLSPDRNHVRFIDQYMKHISYSAFLPHGGCMGNGYKPYRERRMDVSFMGSYTPPERIKKEIEGYPQPMRVLMEEVITRLLAETDQTMEQVLWKLLSERGKTVPEAEFPQILSEFRVVDRYMRSYFRDLVIRTLVTGGITVDVFGHGWESFPASHGRENIRIHPPVPYEESLDLIADSKISLNVMPWFKDGAHDRVFTAMTNGAICLTDGSGYLQEILREEETVYFYSLRGIRFLPVKVRKILQNEAKSCQIAEKGKILAGQHDWKSRAGEVMDYLEQVIGVMRQEPQGVTESGGADYAWYEPLLRQNVILQKTAQGAVRSLRKQEYLFAMRQTRQTIDLLSEALPLYLQFQNPLGEMGVCVSVEAITSLLGQMMEAQERKDYILLADLLECSLLPMIQQMQEAYALVEAPPDTCQPGLRLEYTSSGLYTLAVQRGQEWYYLHTNGDIWAEAVSLAESWYESGKCRYIVYGAGLGYHVQALAELDDSIEVLVLEQDPAVWQLACDYGVGRALLADDRVEICVDADYSRLIEVTADLGEDDVFVIHYPSLCKISEEHYRCQLEEYFIEYSSARSQRRQMQGNFTRNRNGFSKEVGQLREHLQGKRVFIIAAGPSLDQNMMELKQVGEDDVILATGTVLKKLLEAGIRPDYVIITDSGRFTYRQTEGLQEQQVPLIYLPTVYYKIPAQYPGERYVMFQRGLKQSEEYAAQKGYDVYESGGSVTTTALELAIRMGAGEIVFVGLDLAYPDGRHHASHTANGTEEYHDAPEMVEDIHGKLLPTGKNMRLYQKWIEKRIANESGISFLDATEGGARIAHTKLMSLSQIVGGGMPHQNR